MKVLLALLICVLALLSLLILLFLIIVVSSLAVNKNKEYGKDSSFYRFLLDITVFFTLKFSRVKIKTEGIEKIPKGKNFLLVGNHRSNFDPVIVLYILKNRKIGFVSKNENFNAPVYGKILKRCSCVPIDREDPKNAIRTINSVADRIVNDNIPFCVYPEGTRSKTGELLPFHDGVFRIAQKANVPVVVVATEGSEKISKNFPLHSSCVSFKVCTVISAEEIKSMRTSAIGCKVREELIASLENK